MKKTAHTPSDVHRFTDMTVSFRDQRGWKDNPKDSALALVAETGELIEHFKWHATPEAYEVYIKENKQAIAEELCDVLFWVLLIARNHNIDLVEEFPKKMKKNERKYPLKGAKK
jgi:NTP pyrophosphatase (non-canonical NTP hydrolase)